MEDLRSSGGRSRRGAAEEEPWRQDVDGDGHHVQALASVAAGLGFRVQGLGFRV